MGLPAPKAPVALFLRRPSGYAANSIPIAGGDMTAVPSPRNPQSMFIAIGFGAKNVMREKRLRKAMPVTSCILLPKRSAVLPKKSMNDPLARL